jgi:hypothetical protein
MVLFAYQLKQLPLLAFAIESAPFISSIESAGIE